MSERIEGIRQRDVDAASAAFGDALDLLGPPPGAGATDGGPGDLFDPQELEPRDLTELARRADELLAMENAGITDSWREDG